MEKICIPRIPLFIVHTWCTELSQTFVASSLVCAKNGQGLCHLQYLVISSMQRRRRREHLRNLVTCSDVRRIGRHMFHCRNSQLINQNQERWQTVVTCFVQWVCHAINKSFMSFLPERTSIFRSQNYLPYACCHDEVRLL